VAVVASQNRIRSLAISKMENSNNRVEFDLRQKFGTVLKEGNADIIRSVTAIPA
jgi:hypothetical protein